MLTILPRWASGRPLSFVGADEDGEVDEMVFTDACAGDPLSNFIVVGGPRLINGSPNFGTLAPNTDRPGRTSPILGTGTEPPTLPMSGGPTLNAPG